MSKTFKCNTCGKEFTYDSPALERWAETKAKPEQIKCPDCFGKKKGFSTPTKEVKPTVEKAMQSKDFRKRGETSGKVVMSAELLKQKYDELCAVFGDNLDEVKDYLGGWTTTLALSETR